MKAHFSAGKLHSGWDSVILTLSANSAALNREIHKNSVHVTAPSHKNTI